MRKEKRKKSLCGFVPYDKHQQPSLVQPEKWLSYVYGNKKWIQLPQRAILCFSDGLAIRLRKKRVEFQRSLPTASLGFHIDLYKKKEQSVIVVSHFGVGAPAAVLCLEKLRVMGVKEFVSLGWVGSLTSRLPVGSRVICTRAFRGEGCSYHYLEPSRFVCSPANIDSLKWIQKLKLNTVASWTTDAPFRETKKEYIQFKNKGIECVDMESAALMAVGKHYQLPVFCIGIVSDHLSANNWTPQFLHTQVRKNVYTMLNQILFL